MSETATFEFTLAPDALAGFLSALAAHLEQVGVGADAVVDGDLAAPLRRRFADLRAGRRREECVTLAFPGDAALAAFAGEYPESCSRRAGHVAVGCFWVFCGPADDDLVVSFVSATRSIAQLMLESPSVRAVFESLAGHARDGQMRLVRE